MGRHSYGLQVLWKLALVKESKILCNLEKKPRVKHSIFLPVMTHCQAAVANMFIFSPKFSSNIEI